MSEKLKIGIVGCGGIANGKHLPAIKAVGMADIVATCDIVEERAVKAAKEYGVEGCKVFTDYRELLKLDLDAVFVLTPNRWHSEISCAALESGKHVMCEKPMAHTYEAACKMLDAAKKSGKLLTIGYQSRYRANSQYLKQLCEDGELGEIYLGRANAIRRRAVPTWGVFLDEYAQGGGPLIDIGTHALDLTLWMMNNYKPLYCVGTTYHKLNKDTNQGNAWGAWDPEKFTVEDSAFGFVVMENGATVQVNSAWALNTLVAKGKKTDWMVHMIGQAAGAVTDATHGMTLSAVSLPYYRFILDAGLPKFTRFAKNVWEVSADGKSDREVAEEGLKAMEAWMRELGLAMSLSEIGATEDMIEDIVKGTIILKGGYRVLTKEEIREIVKMSM